MTHAPDNRMQLKALPICKLLFLLVLLVCGGCAAPSEEPGEDQLTAERELPDEFREAWRAWYENSAEWPEWRERVAADPKLANFLVDNLVRVMIKFYERSALVDARSMPGYFERAQRELIWMSDASGPVLAELLLVGDGVVAFLAGDLLVQIDEPRWSLLIAQKLSVEEAEGRRRAAELLQKLPHARKDEAQVLTGLERAALDDPEWYVRAEAVHAIANRALRGSDMARSRKALSRALVDEDRAVVLAACSGLAEAQDLAAVPALLNLLERQERGEQPDIAVNRAAEAAMAQISGQVGISGAPAWRAWWREKRSKERL